MSTNSDKISYSQSKAVRRRLIACLRMAHRVLGMKKKRLALGLCGPDGSGISPVMPAGSRSAAWALVGGLAAWSFVVVGQPANASVIACNPNASSTVSGCTSTGGFAYPATDGTGYYSNVTGAGATGAGLSTATVYGSFASVTGPRATAIGLGATAGQGAIAIGSVQFTGQDATTGAPTGGTPTSATGLNAIAIGGAASATVANSLALGQASVADRAGLGGNAEMFSGTAVASTQGAVSVGAAGAERQIINVAGGTQPTDAVNVRQLSAVGGNLATALGGGAGFSGTTGAFTAPTYTVGGTNYNTVGAAINALGAGGGGAFASDNTAAAPAPVATGANASAGGYGASATGAGSTVVGNGATDNGHAGAVAVGNNAAVLGVGSIAIGQGTTANTAISTQDVADFRAPGNPLKQINNLPAGTTGFVPTGTAIGALSTVGNGGGVAIGYNNNAGNTFQSQVSTAIGADNLASGVNSIALGLNNTASNRGSIAIGTDSQSTGLRAIAMGREAYAYGGFSVAQGYLASAYGANSLSYGPNSVAGVNGGAAAGDVAIGSGATSTLGNSIALGAGSVASRGAETGYTGYAVGTQTSAGELAVGTAAAPRTITGVSAGRLGTDAVNVSQLSAVGSNLAGSLGGGAGFDPTTGAYTAPAFTTAAGTTANTIQAALGNTTAAITTLGNGTAAKLGGGVTYDPTTGQLGNGFAVNGTTYGDVASAISGAAANDGLVQRTGTAGQVAVTAPGGTGANPGAAQVVTNVAAGIVAPGATQAVNGGQLYGTAASVAAGLGGTSTVNPDGTVSAPAYAVGGQTYNNVGAALTASNNLAVQYTPDATGAPTNAIDLTKGGALAPVAVTGLANATTATGAVTLGQSPLQYSTAAAPTTANPAVPSNDVTLVGVAAGTPVGVHNVAVGALTATSTDAVNGSQLYATNQNVTGITSGKAGAFVSDNSVTAVQPVSSGANAAAGGFGAMATGGASTVVGNAATDNGVANSTVLGQGASITGGVAGSNVALGQGSTVAGVAVPVANATIGGNTYAFAGATPAGAVSVGSAGNERQIQNVAAGQLSAASTDAVNGSQLYATNTAVDTLGTSVGNGSVGTVQRTGTANQLALVAPGSSGAAPGAAQNLTNVAPGTVDAASTDAVNGSQLHGTAASIANNFGGGSGVNPDGTVSAPSYTVAGANYNNVGGAIEALTGGATTAGVKYFHANSTGADSSATGANAVAIGSGATSTQAGGVALGSGAAATRAGLAGGTEAFSQTVVNSAQGAVSVGAPGAERQITNVAGGTQATDAVNVRQLSAVGTNLAGSLGGGAGFDPATGAYLAPGYMVGGQTYNNVGAALAAGNALAVQYTPNAAGAPTNAIDLTKGGTLAAVGMTGLANATAATGAVALGQMPLQYSTAAAPITANPAVASNDVTLVGAAAGTPVVVHNLAAGAITATSTDAVNGSQLHGTAASIANNFGGGSVVNSDGTVSAPSYTVAGAAYNNVGDAIGALDNGLADGQIGPFRSDNTAGAAAPAATGANSVAGGFGSSATGRASTVVGNGATDNGNANATVIGNGAAVAANLAGSNTALGQGAVVLRGAENDYAGYGVGTQTSAGELAVGSPTAARTITGVAAGRLGTDAVNVSQLSAVGTNLAGSLGGGAAFDQTTGAYTAPGYTVGGQTYNNVGSALAAGNALAVQYTPDAAGAPTNAIDLTKGGKLAPVAMTGLANATTSTGAVALGQMPLQYSTAAAPTTANPAVAANDVTLVGATAGAPVALHNLADGTLSATSTDAVNGGQLYATNQAVAGLTNGTAGLVQQDPTTRAITVGAGTDGTTVGFANNTGAARTLTGVAAGTVAAGSTQAVNGGQLAGTAGSVAAALGGGSLVNPDGTVSAPTYTVAGANYDNVGSAIGALNTGATNGQLGAFHADNTAGAAQPNAAGANSVAGGFGASATGAASTVVGNAATDNGNANATVVGNGASVAAGTAGSNVALGQGSTVAAAAVPVAGATIGGTNYAFAGATPAGAVSVGSAGNERQIQNVAAGQLSATSTDAVNGSQLYATDTAVNNLSTAVSNGASGAVQRTGTANQVALVAPGGSGAAPGAAQNLTNVATGAVNATSTDAVNGSQLYGTSRSVAGALGGGSTVNADGTVSAPTYNVGGNSYNNVGGAIGALDSSGVKYDTAPGGGRGQSVTLVGGDPNQPVVIHNVAAGKATNDAANVGQVKSALKSANQYATQYTNTQIASLGSQFGSQLYNLQSQISGVRRDALTGAAVGLAAASLRYDDRPGKFSLAVGGGFWGGYGATAFGAGYTLPDGNVRLNLTGATDGRYAGAGGGLTWTFN